MYQTQLISADIIFHYLTVAVLTRIWFSPYEATVYDPTGLSCTSIHKFVMEIIYI